MEQIPLLVGQAGYAGITDDLKTSVACHKEVSFPTPATYSSRVTSILALMPSDGAACGRDSSSFMAMGERETSMLGF